MSKRKGGIYERELLDLFFSSGYGGVRVAGSGCSKHPSPDIVVGGSGRFFAFEVKSTRNDFVYISNEQLSDLRCFAECFGCTPLVAVKFIKVGWRFFSIPVLDKNNYRFDLNMDGMVFNSFQ